MTEFTYFHAKWCGNCDQQKNILEELDIDYESVDVGTDEGQALANRYQIRSLPAIVVKESGEIQEVFRGLAGESKLAKYM